MCIIPTTPVHYFKLILIESHRTFSKLIKRNNLFYLFVQRVNTIFERILCDLILLSFENNELYNFR